MSTTIDRNDVALIEMLHEARRSGRAVELPGDELDLDEALAVQLAVSDRFAAAGEPIGGWKVGQTSGPARESMGEGVRPFGYVLEHRILHSGDDIAVASIHDPVIEAELSLVLGEPLRGEVTQERARAAVDRVVASFEIVERRVAGKDPLDVGTKVAAGLNQWGLVLGESIPTAAFHGGTRAELVRDGDPVGSAIAGEDLLIDDVFLSLAHLCARLDHHGRGLAAGQTVLTGAFVLAPVTGPGRWRATFREVGQVEVRFV